MSTNNFTPEEKQLLQQLYRNREDVIENNTPSFEVMWQKAEAQKSKKSVYRYLRVAAMVAVILTGLIWSYLSFTTTEPTPDEYQWSNDFYNTWQMPSDELLTMSVYDFAYTNTITPTNYLLNLNNEDYYENSDAIQD